jgi:signal transduction histidine kinase
MSESVVLSSQIWSRPWARYAGALLATAIALLARFAVNPILGDYLPYITFFPVVAFAAWYCGIIPSVLVIISSLIATQYWFIPPTHSLRILSTEQLAGIVAFTLVSFVVLAMGEARRRNDEVLRKAQGELEERVQERTAQLDTANQSLRELTARLLQLQDDERRRIARELHDSVGQLLAGLTMNLSAVGADIERLIKTASMVTDSAALVHEINKEVRTISHLLHPPLLDEAGLASALRWYIEGFAERSKIKVDLEFPDDFGRLSRELETAIFRTVQECLTNIHRHADSPIAKISVARTSSDVRVEVADVGKGISPEKQEEMTALGTPGVGIRGMRERLRQLGGSLDINSNGKGTVVVARLPIVGNSATAAA